MKKAPKFQKPRNLKKGLNHIDRTGVKTRKSTLSAYLKSRKDFWAGRGDEISFREKDKAASDSYETYEDGDFGELNLKSQGRKSMTSNPVVTGDDDFTEIDLGSEAWLAKKLKVKKKDRLPGIDDGLNSLMGFVDDPEEGNPDICGCDTENHKNSSLKSKKRKKARVLEREHPPQLDETMEGAAIVEKNPSNLVLDAIEVPKTCLVLHPESSREANQDLLMIRRKVQRLFNLMSASNVESITGEIAMISKSVGGSAGSNLVCEEVLKVFRRFCGDEQIAAIFAAFVAGMTTYVGRDFSVNLMASLARSFEEEYLGDDSRYLQSISLLLAYLYVFGICSVDVVYDFLTVRSEQLNETDISVILAVLKCCGMKLRDDGPNSMMKFIQGVQNRVEELRGEEDVIDRMGFALETLIAIKNNTRRTLDDHEVYGGIKKWLHKAGVSEVMSRDVTWSRLSDPKSSRGPVDSAGKMSGLADAEMTVLASTHGMNTESRRSIFRIVMTGEDYVDASEKLLRLDLPGKLDRDIMRVILHCCLSEKHFNRYYALLASNLCDRNRNHKFTLQYCLWDRYKQLESMAPSMSVNLSRFAADVIGRSALSLTVVKTADLGDSRSLTPRKILHFRLLFETLLALPATTVSSVFAGIARDPHLGNSIEFFVDTHVLKHHDRPHEASKAAKEALRANPLIPN